ncbi:MAG: TonB-dependent receptor [Pseudomonadota bacterium]
MTGNDGYCRTRGRIRASLGSLLIAFAVCFSSPAAARDTPIAIPATTLDSALVILAREAGVEIISTEPGLRSVKTRAISGTMSPREALARLLDGTGYRAQSIAGGYRIVRVQAPTVRKPRPARFQPPSPSPPALDIVITASKQRIPLLRYPGSLTLVDGLPGTPIEGKGSLTDLARAMPILQSTQLGAGRNKVFIRGVADSSFNGSAQSPTSIYLDDVQLNYSGADPGLRLYDMRSVEALEGPQGTLYGAGAIGGVIRLTSNPVDLSRVAGSTAGGVTATLGGAAGVDLAGTINLPLITDRLGLRAVGYIVRDGGFIDDTGRGLSNINRTDTVGGRVALRLDPGGGWRVETSGAIQQIDARDGQYTETAEGPLARRSRIAQPFTNRLLFGRFVLSRDWDNGLRFFAAAGIVGYLSTDQFDATPRAPPGVTVAPVIYIANREKRLLSQETRLSRSLANGNSWVAGFSLVSDRDILSRSIGAPGNDREIIGVTNVTRAASVFAEATVAILPGLSVTGGARATTARTDGYPSITPRSTSFVKGRSTRRIDPTVALSWQVASRMALFARFQTGYRTGGLAVAPGVGRVADYRPDAITVGEIGARKLRSGVTGIDISASISLARWRNIQADLINRSGQPYTTNIGDAKIVTVEGHIDWVPVPGLRAAASFLLTDNTVTGPIADLSQRNNRRLPETPPLALHGGLSYEWTIGSATPQIGITTDYVGRSVLGTGDLLDLSQGKFWVVGMSAGLRWRRLDVSIVVDNLTNSAGNRFAFGNPFSLAYRDQATPLRPLNMRVGVGFAW